jgi:hypothetical protein
MQWLCEHEAQVERVDVLGKPTVEGGEDGLADGSAPANNIVIPEADY